MARYNKRKAKRAAYLVNTLGKSKREAGRLMGVHHEQVTRFLEYAGRHSYPHRQD